MESERGIGEWAWPITYKKSPTTTKIEKRMEILEIHEAGFKMYMI